MSRCCDPYEQVFTGARAARHIDAYRRRGLDSTAGPMVEALGSIEGARVIEVGGGSGVAQVEMLRLGAAVAVSVDMSTESLKAAEELVTEGGFRGQFTTVSGDFVTLATDIPNADVVFLNRVVCCYPNMPALVDAVVASSTGRVALSYPRNRWWVRAAWWFTNLLLRLRRVDFRIFIHDPNAIADRVGGAGFSLVAAATTPMWHWAVWQRSPD